MASTNTSSRNRAVSTTDLALIATFAALIAVCAILPSFSITGVGVPFTLQMFGIFLAAAVLGARRGLLAVLLYLAVGTAGVPIFAENHGGPSVWVGVSAGYLVAFPIAAFVVGLVASRVARSNPAAFTVVVSAAAAIVTIAIVTPTATIAVACSVAIKSIAQQLCK